MAGGRGGREQIWACSVASHWCRSRPDSDPIFKSESSFDSAPIFKSELQYVSVLMKCSISIRLSSPNLLSDSDSIFNFRVRSVATIILEDRLRDVLKWRWRWREEGGRGGGERRTETGNVCGFVDCVVSDPLVDSDWCNGGRHISKNIKTCGHCGGVG